MSLAYMVHWLHRWFHRLGGQPAEKPGAEPRKPCRRPALAEAASERAETVKGQAGHLHTTAPTVVLAAISTRTAPPAGPTGG